jgi:hypothetical protein
MLQTVAGSLLTLSPSQSLRAKSVTEGRSNVNAEREILLLRQAIYSGALAAQTIEPCLTLEPGSSRLFLFCQLRNP